MNVVYLIIKNKFLYVSISKNTIEGTTAIERKDCEITVTQTYDGSGKDLIDGNVKTRWFSTNGGSVSIDMTSKKQIKGISFTHNYGTYGSTSYSPQIIEVLISNDGENWKSLGKVIAEKPDGGSDENPISQYIKFKQMGTQYVKLIVERSYNCYFGISEINVFE